MVGSIAVAGRLSTGAQWNSNGRKEVAMGRGWIGLELGGVGLMTLSVLRW